MRGILVLGSATTRAASSNAPTGNANGEVTIGQQKLADFRYDPQKGLSGCQGYASYDVDKKETLEGRKVPFQEEGATTVSQLSDIGRIVLSFHWRRRPHTRKKVVLLEEVRRQSCPVSLICPRNKKAVVIPDFTDSAGGLLEVSTVKPYEDLERTSVSDLAPEDHSRNIKLLRRKGLLRDVVQGPYAKRLVFFKHKEARFSF